LQGAIQAIGQRAIIINHLVETNTNELIEVTSHFYPVFYVLGLQNRLFSIGTIIQMGYECRGTPNCIALYKEEMQQIHFTSLEENKGIFVLQARRPQKATL